MNAHRLETTLTQNGVLTLQDLPFAAGDAVEVIVLEKARNGNGAAQNGVEEKSGEEWLNEFKAAVEQAWQRESERPDVPRDLAANFDAHKPSIFDHGA